MLMSNKNFRMFTLSYMQMYGIYTCLSAIINNLLEPYNYYTTTDCTVIGGLFIFAGIITSFVTAV